MQKAWELLNSGDKVSSVSYQIGYLSEAAFSRAFKKQFNLSAGSVRRQ
jgi:AraC-like DNA-binding protein